MNDNHYIDNSPNKENRNSRGLASEVDHRQKWPTPAARDYKGANSLEHCEVNGTGRKHMDQLPNAVAHGDKPEPSGALNPTWVEWLMGWPIGWTSMDNAQEVVWACDCDCECGDDDCRGECGCIVICSKCGGDYSECRDIGPTEDNVKYEERDGILYGTRTDLDWRDWKTDPADELPPEEWRSPAASEPGITTERLRPIEGGELGGMNRHFDKDTGRMAQIGITQQVKIRDKGCTGSIPRVATGIKHRVGRLKAIGNGQVPQVAAMAWNILNDEI